MEYSLKKRTELRLNIKRTLMLRIKKPYFEFLKTMRKVIYLLRSQEREFIGMTLLSEKAFITT